MANYYKMSDATKWALENAVWYDEKRKQRATPKIVEARFADTMRKALRHSGL